MRRRLYMLLLAALVLVLPFLHPPVSSAQDSATGPDQLASDQAVAAPGTAPAMPAAINPKLEEELLRGIRHLPSTQPGQATPASKPATGDKTTATTRSREQNLFGTGFADQQFAEQPRQPATAVNLHLKRFGYDFFRKSAAGFRPDSSALVGPDYVVGPGDTLQIDVWGNIEGNYRVTLDRNGDITLPKVGVIHLWGENLAQARETIHKQISKYFSHFELNVTLGELRSIQVFLVGEVNAPGTYHVSSLATVLTALSAAGGPALTGSLRNVELLRRGKKIATIDFYNFLLDGDNSQDQRLESGDTIFVPVVGPLVGVAGNVRRPAIYELKGKQSLAEVLKLAGGIVPTAYLQKVQVSRVDRFRRRTVIDLNLSDLLSGGAKVRPFLLQDHDLVQIAPIVSQGGYVVLSGYVTRPGKYELVKGMRLSDLLLKYDNLLPEYYPTRAQIIRREPPEFDPRILTINLKKALAGDPSQNLKLQEFDEVRIFSRKQMEQMPEVKVNGAVLHPGTYRLYDGMTVRDLLTSAGNPLRGAYLAQAELTRYLPEGDKTVTQRKVINLGRALQGDPSQNLVLEPNDRLLVRRIPDYNARMQVVVHGEVRFPGTYTIRKGETLSSLLQRAGGFTSQAYLRGAVFTRRSLKKIQRQRLDRLISEQEQEIYRTAADIAGGALSADELKSAQTLLESRKKLVAKLKQMPVLGRMVVHLSPLRKLRGSVYDIQLVDGDQLTIPDNPHSVTVLGQVYNPVSMTYRPGKTVSWYLDQVGGTTAQANPSQMFIVRADGTVVSKAQSGMGLRWDRENWRWVVGGFNVTPLYPGDTLLVPEKFKRTDAMREVKDFSTIIYQMALGAAAVASF